MKTVFTSVKEWNLSDCFELMLVIFLDTSCLNNSMSYIIIK